MCQLAGATAIVAFRRVFLVGAFSLKEKKPDSYSE